ncbi:hypothetical protein FQP34_22035 [Peribacillus simplex]|uniref:Uncharacterized protein n=1 Tax=Peribacillus simplex TaxID=1478 RepID=A0A8B5XU47_9BACI|nr:hypothetical protein [Peribacillus simplex]TVX77815.1 hypothetical protein FQP34_22035 [Peribacillus simplex]
MLKIDRSAVDTAIENMVLFTASIEVLADYETEKQVLVKRGEGFSKRISEIREEHAGTMIDRETVAKDSTSDYIYLSGKMKQLDDEMKIILSLQDQLKEDFRELRQKHLPIIQGTYRNDLSAKSEFRVNETVELVRYELLKAIADYAREVKKQQQPLLPLIGEFLDDEELMSNNAGFRRLFSSDSTNLSYFEAGKSVIAKNHVLSSINGNLHPEIRKPQVKDGE